MIPTWLIILLALFSFLAGGFFGLYRLYRRAIDPLDQASQRMLRNARGAAWSWRMRWQSRTMTEQDWRAQRLQIGRQAAEKGLSDGPRKAALIEELEQAGRDLYRQPKED